MPSGPELVQDGPMTKPEIPDGYAEEFKKRGFILVEEIGSGCSGRVYRATQSSLDRDVAVKVFDNPTSIKNPALRKRFEREAKLLAKVVHPSVPVVLTRGEALVDGTEVPYTVMEFLTGIDLQKIIDKERRLPLPRAVAYSTQILGALAAAHTQKIIHRDVKPSNVMVQPTGHVHLIDFSIGVSLDGAPGLTRVTAEGRQLGTTEYMAPEQKAGRESDQRTDLYTFGLVLFEMLTGHLRIKVDTLDADLSYVPTEVRAIIKKACQENPSDRFQSADAFHGALAPFGTAFRAREEPADALCTSVKCPEARWTQWGYYEGPRIFRETKENCCPDCGSNLVYPCVKCTRPFEGRQFCANCGNRHYEVPTCKACGSWLKLKDMGTDTAVNGCEKCRREKELEDLTF